MDSLLFQVAFNGCNFEVYRQIMAEDIEFYDDRTGLSNDAQQDHRWFREKCAKSISVTRKLIGHSVHQLGDYGAMQQGSHIFMVDGVVAQTSRFITIWERTEDSWIVKRAISFDHVDL